MNSCKRNILSAWWLTLAVLLSSCGQDRSGEYYALIKTKTWMYDVMNQNYLFYKDIPSEDQLDFFKAPQAFLESAASEKDRKNGILFSHVDSVISRSSGTYPNFGMEGTVLRTDGGETVIRILYVQPESPASEAKLKRGDWIIAVDGKAISSNDYSSYLEKPTKSYRFTLGKYNPPPAEDTDTDQDYAEFDTLSTVELAPRQVKEHDLLKSRIVSVGTHKVLYLLYNAFGENTDELRQALQQAGQEKPDAVILDLRYNPGGFVTTAQFLSTSLAPSDALGKPFLYMTYNDKLNRTTELTFDAKLTDDGSRLPEYKNLYIVTTGTTASASEIVINCLRPYMKGKIWQVGEATFGKNVAQELFTDASAPGIELWLTTCSLSNSDKFSDYYENGLTPDYEQTEDMLNGLGEFGTESDQLLSPVFYHIQQGKWPEKASADNTLTRTGRKATVLYRTTDHKIRANRLTLPPKQ